MKLDPLRIITKNNFEYNKKIYFISGNELTLIEKVKNKIIENFRKKENVDILSIDSVEDFVDEIGLFENKKIYLVKNCKNINKKVLDSIKEKNCVFIFAQENSQKIKKIKSEFIKDNDSYLIDCYELDQNSKIVVLNEFLKLSGLEVNKEIYWFLIEKLDNKFGFFENSLNKISELNQGDIDLVNIKKLININETGKEKFFFYLLKKNNKIVEMYREKILTNLDVNELFYFCKFFCQLIIESNNEIEYVKKIPIYLFREKKYLIDIFGRYNVEKKKLLLGLILSTERALRKDNPLSLVFGLRFFLNIKKITIS